MNKGMEVNREDGHEQMKRGNNNFNRVDGDKWRNRGNRRDGGIEEM